MKNKKVQSAPWAEGFDKFMGLTPIKGKKKSKTLSSFDLKRIKSIREGNKW